MEMDFSFISSFNTLQLNQDESGPGPGPRSLTKKIKALHAAVKNIYDTNISILQGKTMSEEAGDSSHNKLVLMTPEMKSHIVQNILKVLNTGTREELMKLKGISYIRADYIMCYREQGHSFKTLDDLTCTKMFSKQIQGWLEEIVMESLGPPFDS